MKRKIIFFIFIFAFSLVFCSITTAANTNYTYTCDDDFNNGNITGLNVSDNQIQLSNNSSGSNYPFIWVPNSNEGTVSKVNTLTGLEVARYKTSNLTYGNPSRTTVDLDGSCWVGNRNIGTAVKIGLLENGGYIDRNHDGIIKTSMDLDGNGVIMNTKDPVTGQDVIELLPWGEDECVLYEVVLLLGKEGTYTPGNYSGPYANDYYTPGPRGLAIDSKNNIWIGTFGTMKYYYVNGSNGQILKAVDVSSVKHTPYGAVIDQYGILWSSGDTKSNWSDGNNVLRLDPSNDSFIRINLPHTSYGLALDRSNHLFVSGLNYYRLSRINILTGEIEWTKVAAYAQGLTVTDDGDVWSANNVQGTVTRYSNDGDIKATIIVGNTPSGVSVDNKGKVWAVDNGDEYIHRINPDNNQIDGDRNIINGVELSKRIVGGTHYGYSDMTGVMSNTITTNRGTWTIIHDSQVNNALWGKVSWNSFEPNGTKITVRVRSSNDKQSWSAWEEVTNGEFLKSTPKSRYLEVETTLERSKGSISPVLYDLTVRALTADVTLTTTVDNPTPKIGDTIKFTTTVKNNGPDTATNVNVYPVIPSGFTVIKPLIGTYSNGIWSVGDLQSGETATFEVTGVVTSEFASQNINYLVNETHNEYDPTANSVSSASVYVPFSNVELSYDLKNGKPTLTVSNSGTDYAFNVAVQTAIPSGFTPGASQGSYNNGLWFIGALSPGGAVTLTLTPIISGNSNPSPPVSVGGYQVSSKRVVQKRGYYKYGGSIPPPGAKSNKNRGSVPMQDTGIPLNFSGLAILLVLFGSYLNKREDKSKINKWLLLIIILFGALLFCGGAFAAGTNQTYTSSDDFNNGTFNNVNGSGDKLELSNSTNPTHNFIWVPNTNQGTISKIDVTTGQEVAKYRTYPDPNPDRSAPFRTVVDSNGNCWMSHINIGSIVKIGLLENGGYVDRNNNGKIETSRDLDGNGVITDNEVLPWGQDECVLWDVILINGNEGTYRPGDYKGVWAYNDPYITSLAVDKENNIWAGTTYSKKLYYIDGATGQILKKLDTSSLGAPYWSIIDSNGVLWSTTQSSYLLRTDTVTNSITRINMPHNTYGITLSGNYLYVSGGASSKFSKVNVLNGTVEWTKPCSPGATSILVTDDGDIWTANGNNVNRYSSSGDLKATIWPSSSANGLSLDKNGYVWTADSNGNYIHRINLEINGVDFSKLIPSTTHVTMGTMTAPLSNSSDRGTWIVIHDSLTNNAYWGTVSWNSYEPKGTKVAVRVRSSNDKINWSEWEKADNGLNLKLTPSGRYLEVEVTLEKFNSTQSPVVYDITVNALNSNALTTDLGVSITGDKNSLNVGDTVKLTITAFNNGPNSANVKVDYKIPFGLKLLSSQGTGTYDSNTGIWNVGVLSAEGNATIELTLQVNNAGSFVNTAIIYGDLASASTKSLSSGMVRMFSVKAASASNSQASYTFTANNPGQTSGNTLQYTFPPVNPPTQPPTQPPNNPPTPPNNPPQPPDYGPLYPKTQLDRDVNAVRDAISRGELNKSVLPEWNPEPNKVDNSEYLSLLVDVTADLVFLGSMAATPGSGEYLQQVKNGMVEAMDSLKMAVSYFSKDPQRAFNMLKRGFQQAGNGFVDDTFMEALSKNTFPLDPNIAQEGLKIVLCKIFPKQADKISTLFGLFGSLYFLTHPLEILEAWGNVAYSFAVDGIGQGDYNKVVDNFWEALKETFTHPIPFGP